MKGGLRGEFGLTPLRFRRGRYLPRDFFDILVRVATKSREVGTCKFLHLESSYHSPHIYQLLQIT